MLLKQKQKNKVANQQLQQNSQVPQYQPNFFTKEIQLASLIGFKCTHAIFFLCWFGLILAGTTIIGFGASNYSQTFAYCSQGTAFCQYDITLDQDRDLYIYAKINQFNQNNRMYLDAYSYNQLLGNNGTGLQCGNYKTYGSFGKAQTSGGYRVIKQTNIHPCGFPMLSLFNDSAYLVQNDGGTPKLTTDIISNYSKNYRYKQLQNSSITQWTNILHPNFINWFTIGTTSTKYILLGKLLNMTVGDYRLIIKNSYPTLGQFNKEIFISEVNNLGVTNHLLGFTLFAYGIGMLLVHVGLCCKSKD